MFVVLLAALFTAFIAATYGFGIYLFPVLMPDMHASLGFTYNQAGIATAGGQVGFLLGALGTDLLVRRWGSGFVLSLAIALCAASLLGMVFVTNIWLVTLWLTLLGSTASIAYTPMVEICQRFIQARRRGTVLCLISSGTSYGVFINGVIVPLAGGDWRVVWLVLAVGVMVLFLTAVVFLYTNGLLNVAGTVDRTTADSTFMWRDRIVLAAQRRVFMTWLLMFINGFTCLSFQTYFSSYLQGELGVSAAFAGSLWSLVGLIGMGGGL